MQIGWVILPLCILHFAFCILWPAHSSAQPVRLTVPYVTSSQKNACGPAVLAMVSGYWEKNCSLNDFFVRRNGSNQPVSLAELARQANKQHFWAYGYAGDLDDLKAKAGAGLPVIVLLRFGFGPFGVNHYAVITGFDPDRPVFYFHSTWQKDSFLSEKTFVYFWRRAGNSCLLVLPPEKIKFSLNAEQHNSLGVFYTGEGKTEQAVQAFQAAVDRENLVLYRFNLAGALVRSGKKEQAREVYRAIIKESEFGPACNNLAELMLGEDREVLAEAEELARKALKIDPDRSAYYLDTLGRILVRQVRNREGREALQKALDEARKSFPEIVPEIEAHLKEIQW